MMILSMDLGKFNSICRFYDTRTRKHRFETIATKIASPQVALDKATICQRCVAVF